MSILVGHSLECVDGAELEKIRKVSNYYKDGAIRVHPEKVLLPLGYAQYADKIFNFQFRDGDVLIIGYPKTGTTWMQEIVWNMANNPNLDSTSTPETYIKSLYLEADVSNTARSLFPNPEFREQIMSEYPGIELKDDLTWLDLINDQPDRRVIKSHLVPSLLNKDLLRKAKVIFTIRDPKDVLASFFHHHRIFKFHSFRGSFEEFAHAFISGDVFMGEYPNLIRRCWLERSHKNALFVYYEDLVNNTIEQLKKINDFIGTGLTLEQLEGLKKATSFEEMKKRKMMFNLEEKKSESMLYNIDVVKENGGFFRKGTVGYGQFEMEPKLNKKVEEYLQKALEGIPLPYGYLREGDQGCGPHALTKDL